ncbi:cytochrome P450 [Coniochaeta sp. 2T2.1]|nr:cytochrome P450 [Coniochaeta sp. 2T2.1]
MEDLQRRQGHKTAYKRRIQGLAIASFQGFDPFPPTVFAKFQAIKRLGLLSTAQFLLKRFTSGLESVETHRRLSAEKTRERIALGSGRDDFLDGLVKSGLSFDYMHGLAALVIVAGSETTATSLTGSMFLLATHPHVQTKLADELRAHFKDESEIPLDSTNNLPYPLAVINESMRYYPVVPTSQPRVVPTEGARVAGHALPPGTVVGLYHWAVYRDAKLFDDPDVFDPERFAQPGVGKYKHDQLDSFNPFLLGPRNCLGQRLALAEMRYVLTRLIWRYEFTVAKESRNWVEEQYSYLLWEKPDLMMRMTPRD